MTDATTNLMPHRSSCGLPRSAQGGAPLATCVKLATAGSLKLRKPLSTSTWNVRSLWRTGASRLLVEQLSAARISHIRPMLQTRKWGAGLGSHQSPVPSYQGDYVCSDISHELSHHKIIPVLFRQPSTIFQPTGASGGADHVEPGSIPSSLTCNRPTLASTRRGIAHKVVPNGVQLWRRLCSPLGVPPDDDDDDDDDTTVRAVHC